MTDIQSIRSQVEQRISDVPGIMGTGISFSTKEIIIYVSDYNTEQSIKNRIGEYADGFKLKFVYSGTIKPMNRF
jgi:hypothetical protein